ncbi:MAG TPA: hypothetical protein VJ810_16125 [Blastocatellia bacterium]|nr:hypothetical protein [Blastocatellia bacterium]
MSFIRFLAIILTLGPIAGWASAQDPVKVAPQAYNLDFENDWVKVLRVRYAAKEKLPEHDHPPTGAAYVYLNDSGPVIFKHIGLSYGAITRPAVKARSFRLWYATKETHEVENTGDTPSDFLRIEFKTDPVNARSLRGKFQPEEFPADENFQKVQFENEQIRATRLAIAPRKKLAVSTLANEPALLVALAPANLKFTKEKAKPSKLSLDLGKTGWIEQGATIEFENTGDATAELLRFDLKTKPLSADQLKPPAHPHD